jgi:predicted O-methyltransferase YrrM
MNQLKFPFKYLHYLFTSKTKHGIHSPFVYDLLTKVIQDKSGPEIFKRIETIREELLRSELEINVNDLGAGSQNNSSLKRKIKDIAKNAAKSPKYAQLLYRLVNHFKPQIILELGTSLGISTIYQAAAVPNSKIITIEGCTETAAIAKNNFSKMQLNNVEQLIGNFDEQLPNILNKVKQLDYVFFDGNHKKAPTLNYFNLCLSKTHNNSLFIFDDIHWSDEMEQAWEIIKNHPQVTVTIDLFFLGLAFFRKEQVKEDFVIRF